MITMEILEAASVAGLILLAWPFAYAFAADGEPENGTLLMLWFLSLVVGSIVCSVTGWLFIFKYLVGL